MRRHSWASPVLGEENSWKGAGKHAVCIKITNNKEKLSSVAFDFGFEAAEFLLHARMPHRQIFIKNLATLKFVFKEQLGN